jgi:2-polyprenyl-3-methyl-5-hydroxy-6-metoxy-1,4-benzoquinol methylase
VKHRALSSNRLSNVHSGMTTEARRPRRNYILWVRGILGATSGFMYDAIKYSIDHYPIPNLRLPLSATGSTFLDIGCNWGRWSVAAAQAGYSVTGIDPSFGALVVAKHVFRQFGLQATFIPHYPDERLNRPAPIPFEL